MQDFEAKDPFDIMIIGAGAAGLMAALELSMAGKKVILLEALNRTGGRMFTADDPAFEAPVELGAEFVHGDLPLTKSLLQQAGTEKIIAEGSIWQHDGAGLRQQEDFIEDYDALKQAFQSIEEDMPVAELLERSFSGTQNEALRNSLVQYVEGYYAADTRLASAQALRTELLKEDEDQYRIRGGYRQLVRYLEQQCAKNRVQIHLGEAVQELHWQQGHAEAITQKGRFAASKALVTVSIGVLQREAIAFVPALPEKTAAAKALGFGSVVKIMLQFHRPFWKEADANLSDMQFLFSDATIPTWWTQHPQQQNLLTGWLAGPRADPFKDISKDALLEQALASLSHIFNLPVEVLQQYLKGAQYHNWSADPFFNGAYAYEVVGGKATMATLLQPVAGTLFFAGEGLHPGPEIGTVEGALQSGKEAAAKMLG